MATHWGWRAVFWLHAGIAFVLLAFMVGMLRESRPAATEGMTLRQLVAGSRVLLRDPVFMSFTLAYSSISAGSFAFITVGAALFDRLFGIAPAAFGTLWAGLALAYLCGAAAGGALGRRYSNRTIITRGLQLNLVAAGCMVAGALLWRPMLPVFMLALLLQMAANGLISPLCLAGCVSERPDLAGVASGLSSALAMLVSMVLAALSGILFDGRALSVAALVGCCALAAWFAARPALRWLTDNQAHQRGAR